MARPHGRYGHGVPRVPTDKPLASPSVYNATTNQRLEQQRWAVVVVAMATATSAGTTGTMVAAVVAKTTAATAWQRQRWQQGQQRQQR